MMAPEQKIEKSNHKKLPVPITTETNERAASRGIGRRGKTPMKMGKSPFFSILDEREKGTGKNGGDKTILREADTTIK
jgi:hypothetical protein